MQTTLFDLQKNATAVAESSVGKDQLAVDSLKLEGFNAAGFDRLDYPKWNGFFDESRANIINLKAQPSPATQVAQAAAKPSAT